MNIEIFQHYISVDGFGGLGVLAVHKHGNSFIEVSTAHCSANDQYSKKVAVNQLRAARELGQVVRLSINHRARNDTNHREIRDFVNEVFSIYNLGADQ